MAQLRWSLSAAEDLRKIEEYIARDSALYAVAFLDRLVQAAARLERFPRAGRAVPEFGRDDLREVIYGSYRLVYRLEAELVTVLRVVHGARYLPELARTEGWELE